MKNGSRAIVLGATQGMGRAVARRLAERGYGLFLLGRDPEELERSLRDLESRRPGSGVGHAELDLLGLSGEKAQRALDAAWESLGGADLVLVTAGTFGTQSELEKDPDRLREVLDVNLTGTVVFCESAARRLAQSGGRLCVFSSVAGDRARRSVALYGTSKAGLSYYLDGLDLRFRNAGVRITCVKPGFVHTGMTAGLPAPPFAGRPESVAKRVVAAVERGKRVVYAPWIWRWVLLVVRLLPRAVLRRVSF